MPAVAAMAKPSSRKSRAAASAVGLSRSARERKTVPDSGQPVAGRDLALGEGQAHGQVDAHDLARRAHLRAEDGVDVGEAVEGQHRLLHRDVVAHDLVDQEAFGPELHEGGADHHPGRQLHQRDAGGLGHERHRAGGPGVGLDHEDLVGLDRVLDVDEPPDVEGFGDGPGVGLDDGQGLVGQRRRRDDAGAVPGMDPRLLDVLHDPADQAVAGVVPQGVDIDLDRVLQEAVDQDRAIGREPAFLAQRAEAGELGHGRPQAVVVVDDGHGPAPEDVGGAHQHRVADPLDDGQGLVHRDRGATGGLGDLQPGAEGVPALAVLGQVDGGGAGAEDHALGQDAGQLEGGLAAQGHDDPDDLARVGLRLEHVEHVLVGQGLEVEAVAGVVVGRHRLRVAVDHDRLEAGVAEGEAGVDAAVVELDALPDPVGTGAEDDRPWASPPAGPRPRPRRSSSGTACGRRTRPRRCRPS